MNGPVPTWILILILGGVILVFALIGFICCYCKKKFKTLYDMDSENDQSMLKESTLIRANKVHKSNSSMESEDSASSFRKTLFQIFVDSNQKPTRAKGCERNRWSDRFRFSKKPKSKVVKKTPTQSSSIVGPLMPTMTEEDEHDLSNANTLQQSQRDRTTL